MHAVIVTTHPIQYQAPLFRLLAERLELTVVFMMRQTPQGQAEGGFGVQFEWDTPLLEGYRYVFATNIATAPSTNRRGGIVLLEHDQLLQPLNADVLLVMGWFPRAYLQVVNWARQNDVPLVCRGESNLLSTGSAIRRLLKTIYFKWLFGHFRAFAVIGVRNREFYRHYGVPESKLCDAPYSVDTGFFEKQFGLHRPQTRKPGRWRIGFAGKLISKKRPLDLIAATAQCRSRDKIEIIIIGDGPLRPTIQEAAAKAKLRLTFRGFLNQSEIVAKGYADLDAIVLPSDSRETWGLVVNEAMTGGIPAIVSNVVGCAPDLIVDGRTGFIFPVANLHKLSESIDRFVAQRETGHDFGPSVRERISKYSIDRTAKGVGEALTAAIA